LGECHDVQAQKLLGAGEALVVVLALRGLA